MPYGILKFKLPEEQEEFKDALNGVKYLGALQDLDNQLRSIIKHSDNIQLIENAEWARELLHQLLTENDVLLWS